MLAARLLFGFQGELFRRAAGLGFDDVSPRHGAVLAYLDEAGTRPGELARLSGRRKQTIGAILDELERLGYVTREPDPGDRRARLIVPTERGLAFIEASDAIAADIEDRHEAALGKERYAALKEGLRAIVSTGDSYR
jgi:DNA-binding MarR family transcriptional regulator